jgi:4,5-dihydroxyphthalate decarboxylase
MSDLRLSFACGLYDRLLPLYKGDVKPQGIDLDFQAIDDPRQIFDRMAKGDFDISEMSSSEHVTRVAAGNDAMVAIPVFVSRVFRHGFVFVNRKAGIASPKDLAGKRIGVSAYTQTAAVFIRGFLQHEYGVDMSSIKWIQGPMNGAGGHPHLPKLVKPIDIQLNKSERTISEMLATGEIDATLGALVPDSFGKHPDVQRLFPDFRTTEKDYYKRTKIFPIMHLIAIKREIHEAHPFVAQSIYDALERSKELAIERMREVGALAYMLPWMADDIREMDEVFGGDAWPYGVEPNRKTLEALAAYMVEQGQVAERASVDKMFIPGVGAH